MRFNNYCRLSLSLSLSLSFSLSLSLSLSFPFSVTFASVKYNEQNDVSSTLCTRCNRNLLVENIGLNILPIGFSHVLKVFWVGW